MGTARAHHRRPDLRSPCSLPRLSNETPSRHEHPIGYRDKPSFPSDFHQRADRRRQRDIHWHAERHDPAHVHPHPDPNAGFLSRAEYHAHPEPELDAFGGASRADQHTHALAHHHAFRHADSVRHPDAERDAFPVRDAHAYPGG